MAQIPQDTIDRIRDAADIVDVVSQYVTLKRQGRNYLGLCPFHDDHRPSMHVSPAKQIYKCFVCGAGGNAMTFIMEMEKIGFVDALRQLGERVGIEVKASEREGSREFFTQLADLHKLAADVYHQYLFSKSGSSALTYLKERGLTEETLKEFQVGLAPNEWEFLLRKTRQRDFTNEAIRKSGLFTKTQRGEFDRFRQRIMFPIFNASGKIIAFGGRSLDPEEDAKYLNSPETPLYRKSEVFYGLHKARESIRKKDVAVLVEGYMDFLQLYQAGIDHAVAVSGTSLTSQHVRRLKKFTGKVVLAYDGDDAGQAAAIRAGYQFLQGGMETRILDVPPDQDPDDWVREAGVDTVREGIENALPLMTFHARVKNTSSLSVAERAQFADEVVESIALIRDGIIRDGMARELAELLKTDDTEVLRKLQRARKRLSRRRPANENETQKTAASRRPFDSGQQKAMIELIRYMLVDDKKLRQEVRQKIDLALFTDPLLHRLAKEILPQYEEIKPAALLDQFDGKEEREVVADILMNEPPLDDPQRSVEECIQTIKMQSIKEKIQSARVKIRDLEQHGKDPTSAILEVTQLQEDLRQMKDMPHAE